ncbi:MAG: hypothetical protein OEV44_03455 [Spirochaetota bacterium]|nr:hypothetical protein [Spirochaetota bacterium]
MISYDPLNKVLENSIKNLLDSGMKSDNLIIKLKENCLEQVENITCNYCKENVLQKIKNVEEVIINHDNLNILSLNRIKIKGIYYCTKCNNSNYQFLYLFFYP